jgi:hypothetical protein
VARTKYTAQQIEQAVDSLASWSDLAYSEDITVTISGEEVRLTYITGQPGGEGSGEDVYVVFKAGTQFFCKSGYYASYDGSNWDGDVREVRPVTRDAIFFE